MPQQTMTDTRLQCTHVTCHVWVAECKGGQSCWCLAQQMESLTSDVSHAFIIIDPECIAVFRDPSGHFGVFDSHSRNGQGLPSYGGTAVLLTFSQPSDLIDHLHQLFADRGTL